MNYKTLKKLVEDDTLQKLIKGETVTIGDKKNQIHVSEGGYFVVEFFEFTTDREGDMFSIGGDFINLEEAINIATNYTSESYTLKKWGK